MSGMIAHWGVHLSAEMDTGRPIAFLDRDGVINVGRQGYVNRPSEVELLPGAAEIGSQIEEVEFFDLRCYEPIGNQSRIVGY